MVFYVEIEDSGAGEDQFLRFELFECDGWVLPVEVEPTEEEFGGFL